MQPQMEAIPVKKPTRQWDAWTRQEEEIFFHALRQVGKNFEKITCSVQSKNKDQVRQYYYRVIKRMNRLLGPGLVLDARNSKDANAAMLSWWSLLEKHSCSASKLHLKPRRFKTFVTALEHQLLKDRKRTRRKKGPSVQPLFIQHASVSTSVNISVLGSDSTNLFVRGENPTCRNMAQRGSPSKTKSIPRRRATSAEGAQPPRQRRKISAAFKRWEKAASAGVTLMAEAAEHLEKAAAVQQTASLEVVQPYVLQTAQVYSAACDVKYGMNGHSSDREICASNVPCNIPLKDPQATKDDPTVLGDMKGVSDVDFNLCNGLAASFPTRTLGITSSLASPSSTFASGGLKATQSYKCAKEIPSNAKNCGIPNCQTVGQNPESTASKLKLQLYPIDIFTRQKLEQDGLNPHLELTLKSRKSVASILQHLTSKWGKSSIAVGELRLFPFDAERVNIASSEGWNSTNVGITAADVYKILGSPEIFRLRYGWLSSRMLQTSSAVNGSNASLNLDAETALSSIEKNPVEPKKLNFCDVVEVQKDLEQVSHQSVAGWTKCAASTLTMEQGTDYHTSSILNSDAKENALEIGKHGKKLLAEKTDGCENINTASTAITFGQVPGVSGIKTESVGRQLSSCSWLYEGSNDGLAQCLWNDEDPLRSNGGNTSPSVVDWVDSFSNISMGELLNQVSRADCYTVKCEPLHFRENSDIPFSLVPLKAGQSQCFTTESLVLSAQIQQQSSMWGAEDTCDSFSFQTVRCPQSVRDGSSLDKASPNPTSVGGHGKALYSVPWKQDNSAILTEKSISEKQMLERSNPITKDEDASTSNPMPLELYLADSLGALDMCMNNQSEGRQGQDIFPSGDSSLGFSGLIGVSGEGNMDSLLGLFNCKESISMYREETHSPFLLCEDSNKERVFQSACF